MIKLILTSDAGTIDLSLDEEFNGGCEVSNAGLIEGAQLA